MIRAVILFSSLFCLHIVDLIQFIPEGRMCKTLYSIKMGNLSRIRHCPCLPSKQRAQVLTGREPVPQKWDRRSPIRGHRPVEFWGLVLTADYPSCRASQAVIPVRFWQLWISSSALQRKEFTYCQWTELAYPDQTYWRPIRPVYLFILGKYKFYQETFSLEPGMHECLSRLPPILHAELFSEPVVCQAPACLLSWALI